MVINCFRASRRDSDAFDPEPVRRVSTSPQKRATFKRQATSVSSSRSGSNASIAQLPPCPHLADPKIDAMMMPLPPDPRPSRCLRLSHPRIYGNIVSDMKDAKGCRDWRNFAVFESDEVDMSISANEYASKKAADYEKRMSQLNSF